jgi:hypothetical protein
MCPSNTKERKLYSAMIYWGMILMGMGMYSKYSIGVPRLKK